MKVLHVIPSIAKAHGGPSQAIVTIGEALAAKGIKVTVLATDDAGPGRRMTPDEQSEEQARFALGGMELVLNRKQTELYKVSLPLARWLWCKVSSYDVVHIHALFSFSSAIAAKISARHRVPYVIRPLGVLAQYGMTKRRPLLKRTSFALLERQAMRRAAAVHCTSEAERDELVPLLGGTVGVVIPLGVEAPARGDPDILVELADARRDRPRILFLSRIDPKKNLEGLLRASALLKARGTAPLLLIAGAGDLDHTKDMKGLAGELGLADSVAWLGAVSGERKAAAWAAADAFVLPSHSENFGIAAAEAMLAGLPCLLGKGVGLAPAAAASGAVRLTSPCPEHIAAGLEALIQDPAEAAATGARGRAYALDHFSRAAMGEELASLYRRIAASR